MCCVERSSNPTSTSGRGSAVKPSSMKAPGPASCKKTVRFDSSQPSDIVQSEEKADFALRKSTIPGHQSIAADSMSRGPQGNEELSRVFALLQGWLDLNGDLGPTRADSRHWHRCADFVP